MSGALEQEYTFRICAANNFWDCMYMTGTMTHSNMIRMVEENGGPKLSEIWGKQVILDLFQ